MERKKMAWKKEIVARDCEWDGVEGEHFDCIRYIECIFYGNKVPDTDSKPFFGYGAYGAVVGGGTNSSGDSVMLSGINSTLKRGQYKVTEEEIDHQVEEFRREIQKNPDFYKQDW